MQEKKLGLPLYKRKNYSNNILYYSLPTDIQGSSFFWHPSSKTNCRPSAFSSLVRLACLFRPNILVQMRILSVQMRINNFLPASFSHSNMHMLYRHDTYIPKCKLEVIDAVVGEFRYRDKQISYGSSWIMMAEHSRVPSSLFIPTNPRPLIFVPFLLSFLVLD